MKRYYTTRQYKQANEAKARSSAKKTRRHKSWKKGRNRTKGLRGGSRTDRAIPYKPAQEVANLFPGYKKVKAPSHFSLIKNPSETIAFITRLKKQYDSSSKTFVTLKDVATLDDDAIVLLLSIMVKFKSKGIQFNGDYPQHGAARAKLRHSGFIENLYETFKEEERYSISTNDGASIHTHAWKNVDPILSAQIVGKASKLLWVERKRCQGVQRTLIELMLNTNNHASVSQGEKHWWLSLTYDSENRKVKFSFVDYGIGIFSSLNGKKEGSKFFGVLQKMMNTFKPKDNGEMLKHILNGELHRTATQQHFRGKGLPGIKEAHDRGWISNLHVITNDVYAAVTEDRYLTLDQPFQGTFIYWEVTTSNLHCDEYQKN